MRKSKLYSVVLSLLISFGLWLYVVNNVSQEMEATFYNIPVVLQGEPMLESYGLMNVTENIPTVTLKLSFKPVNLPFTVTVVVPSPTATNS